ncbi:hypothetical protein [Pseudorhodoferax sp.]|uniref:hypothetical protein n=1 Tax=Pseudorhodoferax sp. TaxID=1993553 RepID=UPI002DD62928|nr:hypothetical protein [Pseudorhodoferax sp.]
MKAAPLLLAAALLAGFVAAAEAAGDSAAELTLRADSRQTNTHSPLAAWAPPSGSLQVLAELRHTQRLPAGLALVGNVLLGHGWQRAAADDDSSRVNELHASADLGAWQLSAGRKVLGWDVAYAFRPNDVVQQETRLQQFGQTPQGRALLMAEHFGADDAWSLVLANPQHLGDGGARAQGGDEAALALRAYRRIGALDLHGFARHGRLVGASVGTALSWVATDELELHASTRLQAHTHQTLLGLQWTGGTQISVLAEAWFDGTASGAARRNLYLRLAWQPEGWTLAADLLATPTDRGRAAGASVQWRGDRWRLEASVRQFGGPRGARLAQSPTRRSLVLAASLGF